MEAADVSGHERSDVIESAREHYVDDQENDVDRGDGPIPDGGTQLPACETPTCDGGKEVVTPDGYVCRDCAEALAAEYERVAADERTVADGGGHYHVVRSDCTFEGLKRERHRAARAVDAHEFDEPSHDVRFEEVTGR